MVGGTKTPGWSAKQIIGYQLSAGVITVCIMRLKHTQTVFNGEAWCNDEKPTGELLAVGAPYIISRLPSDEQGHNCGLARACGPALTPVALILDRHRCWRSRVLKKDLPALVLGATSASQCFNRFDLAKVRSRIAKFVIVSSVAVSERSRV